MTNLDWGYLRIRWGISWCFFCWGCAVELKNCIFFKWETMIFWSLTKINSKFKRLDSKFPSAMNFCIFRRIFAPLLIFTLRGCERALKNSKVHFNEKKNPFFYNCFFKKGKNSDFVFYAFCAVFLYKYMILIVFKWKWLETERFDKFFL